MKQSSKVAIFVLPIILTLFFVGLINALTSPVNLGLDANFAVLAGSTITNVGTTVINGDLGLSPGTSVTGAPTVNGTSHINDLGVSGAVAAQADLSTAYGVAVGKAPDALITGDLGGQTLTPGVYKDNGAPASLSLGGTLTLDGQGDPNAVFVFQSSTTLITAASSVINLINGAQACNVFWQVGTSATLGASSIFKGNILATTAATLGTGANVEGRILTQSAAVTLSGNIITAAVCVAPPPPPPPPPPPVAPLINVVKVPTPLALPGGPGSVTYNYTVTNVGTEPMSNIIVGDDKCSPVTFNSGDTNSNSILDLTEAWNYSCTATVSLTTTNTVTATGDANGLTAIDSANATVVVSVVLPPPLINLVKVPNVFNITSGGTVIYTYTVTNPGLVSLNTVSVVDDKCGPLVGPTGDTNSNNILEVSETWVYTCQTVLNASTVNTSTAQGSANGLTAIDFSIVTVIVTPAQTPAPPLSVINQVIPDLIASLVTTTLKVAGVPVSFPASSQPALFDVSAQPNQPNNTLTFVECLLLLCCSLISLIILLLLLARRRRRKREEERRNIKTNADKYKQSQQ